MATTRLPALKCRRTGLPVVIVHHRRIDRSQQPGDKYLHPDLQMTQLPSPDRWQDLFASLVANHAQADAAHDSQHLHRVVANAYQLTHAEGADWLVVMPAAWLHDCVVVPKSSPDRNKASVLAARQAIEWLKAHDWPHGRLDEIAHAIEAHSFSAGIVPRTLEAKVVQDADRLDALGAVGLARTLMLGGQMGRELYSPDDPLCVGRPPDDSRFSLDHVFAKLLKLEAMMQTPSGKAEAHRRTQFLKAFLNQLAGEIGVTESV